MSSVQYTRVAGHDGDAEDGEWELNDGIVDPPEGRARFYEVFTYGWLGDSIHRAARAELPVGMVVDIVPGDESAVLGKAFVFEFAKEMRLKHLWDDYVANNARVKRLGAAVEGTLKWAGYVQQAPHAHRMYCGVEWDDARPMGHSGTAYGEKLFDAAEGKGTCVDPELLTLVDDKTAPRPRAPNATRALLRTHGLFFAAAGFYKLINDAVNLTIPVVLEYFVKYLQKSDSTWKEGLLLASAFFGMGILRTVAQNKYFHMIRRTGLRFRSALMAAIYDRSLKLTVEAAAHPDLSSGRIVNMMSGDVQRANDVVTYCHQLWSAPLVICVCVGLLYRLVGWAAIAGIIVMLVTTPIQGVVFRRQTALRVHLTGATDNRVKSVNELFLGVRIVKFMGWEEKFVEAVTKLREIEMGFFKKTQNLKVLSSFIMSMSPMLVSSSVFLVFHLSGNDLTPPIVFPTIALLNVMRFPLMVLPMMLTNLVNYRVSMDRITKFLETGDRADVIQPLTREEKAKGLICVVDNATVSAFESKEMPNVSTKAAEKNKKFYHLSPKTLLTNVTTELQRGKLHIIVGPTGCGKSTLLDAILGELPITAGRVRREGTVAYVPQQPWIMNGTVKDNVTFFQDNDDARFQRAVDVCQLSADIPALVNGIDTEIGERGINLSGGQKARLSLARAVYGDRDIYILDDPLSAVDSHVGEKLMNDCFCGALSGKTRVLATHQVQFVNRADVVIVMREREIVFTGTPDEFNASMYHDWATSTDFDREGSGTAEEKPAADGGAAPASGDAAAPGSPTKTKTAESSAAKPAEAKKDELVYKEEKAEGGVPMSTYWKYAVCCGGLRRLVPLMLAFTLVETVNSMSSVWLSLWSEQAWGLSQSTFLYVYISFIGGSAIGAASRVYLAYESMRQGSLKIHKRLLDSVVVAPMQFFDTTPLGRILNRFAKDIDQIDNDLPMGFIFFFQMCFSTAGALVIMVISQPVIVPIFIPIAVVYYKILLFFNAANRESKRIDSINKSPVFVLLSEILTGCRTIGAFNVGRNYMREGRKRLDNIMSSSYFRVMCNRWLALRLETIGTIIVTALVVVAVIGKQCDFGQSHIGLISLGITISQNITTLLNFLIRQCSEVEAQMNSVERVIYYTDDIPHEERFAYSATRPKPLPIDGAPALTMTDVCMRYRDGLPLVLKNVSLQIQQGEKIGVVGRTGSGKSSLMLVLTRMVDITSGEILLMGANTRAMNLPDLRGRFSMIPQDPVLFQGTVRSNVDPFEESTDKEVLAALRRVGMEDRVLQDADGIMGEITEGGANFSVGERQLLCLARALLKRNCSFLLMDEATANIDIATDKKIQVAIREAFVGYTVLTVAHRLNTIMDSTRVLVLDDGKVAGFDTPAAMAADTTSAFRKLLAAQGPEQERALLRQIGGATPPQASPAAKGDAETE